MVQAPVRPLTLTEFLAQPEIKPAREYIDGQIFPKPMPQGKHSTIQTQLAIAINGALKRSRIAKAYTGLRCTFGGRSLVPDVAVFAWSRIPRDASGQVSDRFELTVGELFSWLLE